MILREHFKNLGSFALNEGDVVYFLDERYTEFYYIKRANQHELGGIYYATTGKLVLREGDFDDAFMVDTRELHYIGEPFLCVQKGEMYGAYSIEDGRQMIPIRFKQVMKYQGNLLWVKGMDGKCGVYTDTGKEVLPTKYRAILQEDRAKKFLHATCKEDGDAVISKSGKVLLMDEKDGKINLFNDFYTVQYADRFRLCNLDGTIYEGKGKCKYLRNGLFEVKDGKKTTVIDLDGNTIVSMLGCVRIKKSGEFLFAEKEDGTVERIFLG